MDNEKHLIVVRSQWFKIPIPDDMDTDEVKEMVLSGEMYTDEWYEKFPEEEELSDYSDDFIDLFDGKMTERIIG